MKIHAEHRLSASPQKAWDMLNDPDVLAKAIPGSNQLIAEGEDRYRAEMSVGMGFIRGKFGGTLQITDKAEPESYRIQIEGSGSVGAVEGKGQVKLTETAPDRTTVTVSGDAVISGLIAKAGERALSAAANSMMEKFFENIEKQIQADQR